MYEYGLVLPAAQSAMASDQLLESGDLVGAGVDTTVQQDVRRVRQLVVASEVVGCVRTEPEQGVDALDRAVGQPVCPVSPQDDGAAAPTPHQQEPDPRMVGEAGK
jgi:hypothetical protein